MYEWVISIFGLCAAILLIGRNRARLLALVAVVVFGLMYGPVFVGRVQAWNVFHYWLGAKYFSEMGYVGLYQCAIQVEEDVNGFPVWFGGGYKRDLVSYQWVPRADVGTCPRGNFSEARWTNFVHDLTWLHDQPTDRAELWRLVMLDKGLNVTPTWLAIFGRLAQITPGTFLFWLWLYADLAGLLVGLFVVYKTFGLERAALAGIFITTWFGTLTQIMGHWFQYEWLTFMLIGFCALKRNRPVVAGITLAAAAAMRIFPAAALGIMLFDTRREGQKFWSAASVTLVAMFLIGSTTPHGIDIWWEFTDKMLAHTQTLLIEPMNIGLTNTLNVINDVAAAAQIREFFNTGAGTPPAPYQPVVGTWVGLGVGLATALVLLLNKRSVAEVVVAFVFMAVNLSRYYYQLLVLLLLEDEGHRTPILVMGLSLFYTVTAGLWPMAGNALLCVVLYGGIGWGLWRAND